MNQLQSLYHEINLHLMQDKAPSRYLNSICDQPVFQQYPFHMLYLLRQTRQSPQHHPEGSVWNHTMLVTDKAAEKKIFSNNPTALMWAALLHDIGKPATTRIRKGKITAYGHEKTGEKLAEDFLNMFTHDTEFIKAVTSLVRWHMQILFVVNELPFADIDGMKAETNIQEVGLLGLCDRLGRLYADEKKEEENLKLFMERCK